MSAKDKPASPRRGQVRKQKGEAAAFVPAGASDDAAKLLGAVKTMAETVTTTAMVKAAVEGLNVYWLNGRDVYIPMPAPARAASGGRVPHWKESHFKRELRISGISSNKGDASFSQEDLALSFVQRERQVEFAGDLAGYPVGIHTVAGRRLAVTGACTLIEPKAGPWPVLEAFLRRFVRDEIDQRPYFMAWLKQAVASLRAGERRPGHLLVLTGESDSAKSFTQEHIITPLLGGRASDPRRYLIGETQFTGQLFGCEHLMMQELPSGRDPVSRGLLAETLKQLIVNESMPLRAMYQEAITVTPFRRVTLSMNENVEKLQSLPALTSDFADKVIILSLASDPMPMPTDTDEQRRAFREAIGAELPAFLHSLLEWEIPPQLREGPSAARFGLNAWQHPAIGQAIFEQETESKLLWIIDHSDLFPGGEAWGWDTAAELEETLTKGPEQIKAEKLFRYPGKCAELLGKLRKHFPERFVHRHGKDGNKWLISPKAA